MKKLEPLLFEEDFHAALWGGERWLVSVHSAAPSVVKGGAFAGRRLDDLVEAYGAALVGERAGGRFPLLIKDIDAKRRLSVQVHPNEATAPAVGGEPKTEMWHVLSAEAGGALFAGIKPGTKAAELASAVQDGRFEDLLIRHEVQPGDAVFVPGGLVHAIGDGVRVFEVQQSSNTTYRLYDWGRVGADGRPRQLHVKEGLATADLGTVPVVVRGTLACPFFRVKPRQVVGTLPLAAKPTSFRVLFAKTGAFEVQVEGRSWPVAEGAAVLLPAALPAVRLVSERAEILDVSL